MKRALFLFSSLLLALSSLPAAPGDPDTGFNPSSNGDIVTVVVQSDGKILVAGGFSQINGTARRNLARLNADGSLDSSFAPNPNLKVFAFLAQPDGKIVIGGAFSQVSGISHPRLARLGTDGRPEIAFDPNAEEDSEVEVTIPRGDGRILLGGAFETIGGQARDVTGRTSSLRRFTVIRR